MPIRVEHAVDPRLGGRLGLMAGQQSGLAEAESREAAMLQQQVQQERQIQAAEDMARLRQKYALERMNREQRLLIERMAIGDQRAAEEFRRKYPQGIEEFRREEHERSLERARASQNRGYERQDAEMQRKLKAIDESDVLTEEEKEIARTQLQTGITPEQKGPDEPQTLSKDGQIWQKQGAQWVPLGADPAVLQEQEQRALEVQKQEWERERLQNFHDELKDYRSIRAETARDTTFDTVTVGPPQGAQDGGGGEGDALAPQPQTRERSIAEALASGTSEEKERAEQMLNDIVGPAPDRETYGLSARERAERRLEDRKDEFVDVVGREPESREELLEYVATRDAYDPVLYDEDKAPVREPGAVANRIAQSKKVEPVRSTHDLHDTMNEINRAAQMRHISESEARRLMEGHRLRFTLETLDDLPREDMEKLAESYEKRYGEMPDMSDPRSMARAYQHARGIGMVPKPPWGVHSTNAFDALEQNSLPPMESRDELDMELSRVQEELALGLVTPQEAQTVSETITYRYQSRRVGELSEKDRGKLTAALEESGAPVEELTEEERTAALYYMAVDEGMIEEGGR